ncbi:MAG TPA: LptF/LptG family permease [Bacteroidia bacterium]|nr:LptF/LptG family permease [Bacteroidia bacterium]
MKKLTLLVLRAFAGPMVLTFLISLFVLLMQFLWKYIDDLVGKGLDWIIIGKLMVYVSITLVPLALPLAILLSSIMTFGNMAEHFEITACKSAGMSLQRIMRPLIVTAILICITAFFFSNVILPMANLKMNALLYDVRQQKPALYIKEGVFYNGIDGYSIKIGEKSSDGKTLHDIMIYDHRENRGNTNLIMAESGSMVMSDDERFLILTLNNGTSYEEKPSSPGKNNRPLMRSEFEQQVVRFDLSSFKMTRTNEQLFKDNYQMLNLGQLEQAADSIENKLDQKLEDLYHRAKISYAIVPDSMNKMNYSSVLELKEDDILKNFEPEKRGMILNSALLSARNMASITSDIIDDLDGRSRVLAKHRIEWHRKFTLSFACLILFFIGAPLGAIIRKGGLGLPVVVSIILFVSYHVISISAEKFAREGVLTPFEGMWMSSIILLPVGIFLTYKATTDSALFDRDSYLRFIKRFSKRKTF